MKKVFIFLCVFFTLVFICIGSYFYYSYKRMQIPVLVYHNIVSDDEYLNGDVDSLTKEVFESHLKYLKKKGYRTITPDQLNDWIDGKIELPNKSILLTFDDGFYSFKYFVEPLLEKYDMNATNFLIGDVTFDETPKYVEGEYGTLGKDYVRDHDKHVTLASHTYHMHGKDENGNKKVDVYSEKNISKDIKDFNKDIVDTEYVAYPFYTYSKNMHKAMKENNYKLGFCGEEEMVSRSIDKYAVYRINAVRPLEDFKTIFETNKYRNKYGNGILRKIVLKVIRTLNKE